MFGQRGIKKELKGIPTAPAVPSYSITAQRAVASDRAAKMRDAYSNGIRCKGFTVTITATGTSSYTVDLSGMAKNFLGFGWYIPGTLPTQIIQEQLVINNDVVVDSTLIYHHLVQNNTSDRDYYAFPRPLNGQDTIVFNFTNAGAVLTAYLVVYYI
jgi:hypothetical protein